MSIHLVTSLYARLGITVDWTHEILPDCGVAYMDHKVAVGGFTQTPWLALHDLAHYLVASEDRRNKVNFELGWATHVIEKPANEDLLHALECKDPKAAREEETLASSLHVLLVSKYMGERNATKTLYSVSVDRRTTQWKETLKKLQDRGLLSPTNLPMF